jgi:hypothetical protein
MSTLLINAEAENNACQRTMQKRSTFSLRIYSKNDGNAMITHLLQPPCYKWASSQPFFCSSFSRDDIACHQVHLGMLPESLQMWPCPRCLRSGGESMVRGRAPSGVFDYHRSDCLCLGQIFSFKIGTRTVIGTVNTICCVN